MTDYLTFENDMWDYLAAVKKPILMYGMGNGADKILNVCEQKNIPIADFFASDGFVRGHSFHGKVVLSYSAAKEKYGHFIVLLSFATSLPDVMENIETIAAEQELYAPDVPVFGTGLFDLAFYREHSKEIRDAMDLLEDQESKKVMECIIRYKITGKIHYLTECTTSKETALICLLDAPHIHHYVDLGAYNGDTVRELCPLAPKLATVSAWEPDARNFRKLSAYADTVKEFAITPLPLGAWDRPETLYFDASGNRNANLSEEIGKKSVATEVNAPDIVLAGKPVDYIKYDVEGSERQALMGSRRIIAQNHPKLLVSLYHRNEDIFALPLLLKEIYPGCRMYLRKHPYIPGWDLNLYVLPPQS